MTIFISQDLWDLIEDGFQDPPGTENQKEYKEKLKKNAKGIKVLLAYAEFLLINSNGLQGLLFLRCRAAAPAQC